MWATYLICSVGPFPLACLPLQAASILLLQVPSFSIALNTEQQEL